MSVITFSPLSSYFPRTIDIECEEFFKNELQFNILVNVLSFLSHDIELIYKNYAKCWAFFFCTQSYDLYIYSSFYWFIHFFFNSYGTVTFSVNLLNETEI